MGQPMHMHLPRSSAQRGACIPPAFRAQGGTLVYSDEVRFARPKPSKRNYLLNADGSGTGTTENPAQGAIGVVLRDPDGHIVAEISRRIGPAINTVAEYRALIEGLKLARSRGIQRIRVFLDSELVVDQVNGRAKVRKEHIRPLHTEACSLLQEFPNIRISWVPRKWNAEADGLAAKALLGLPHSPVTNSELLEALH
jgi:ribonuclease HI